MKMNGLPAATMRWRLKMRAERPLAFASLLGKSLTRGRRLSDKIAFSAVFISNQNSLSQYFAQVMLISDTE